MAKALGTIVDLRGASLENTEIYSGILDYYDQWSEIDPRLAQHHPVLSRAANVFGHDLVNMATYAHEILGWLQPDRIVLGQSVVSVGGMTEAYFVSVRSACDAVADALAYRACSNVGQVPSDSLRALVTWAQKNKSRVNPIIANILSGDLQWFWSLRSLRDHIVHNGVHAVIHTDRKQFNLWVISAKHGWVTREPLLPLLASTLDHLLAFADRAADAINKTIDLPPDRLRSRAVSGILIPALHEIRSAAGQYAVPVW